MPGFVTHYIFGTEAFRDIQCDSPRQTRTLKRNLSANRSVYSLGQQGPDLFFYYLPSYVLEGHNLGAIAHVKETGAFFRGLLKCALTFENPYDRAIAESYLYGFLGHYTLDTVCHPYIYAMTHYKEKRPDYFHRHAYLETDIDTSLLNMKLHRKPYEFHSADTIVLTTRQKKVVAKMLYYAYRYAYPELRIYKPTMFLSIFSLRLGMRILHDDSGQKKAMVRLTERYFLGYPLFSPLFPSNYLFFRTDPFNLRRAPWRNPWDKSLTSNETFFDLYSKAEQQYLSRLKKLYTIFHNTEEKSLRDKHIREFLSEYGNLSFHSGLDCSIPS